MSTWLPIETAPHDRPLLVWTGQNQYVGTWVKNIETGDEMFMIADLGEGNRLLCKPTHWQGLPDPPAPEVPDGR